MLTFSRMPVLAPLEKVVRTQAAQFVEGCQKSLRSRLYSVASDLFGLSSSSPAPRKVVAAARASVPTYSRQQYAKQQSKSSLAAISARSAPSALLRSRAVLKHTYPLQSRLYSTRWSFQNSYSSWNAPNGLLHFSWAHPLGGIIAVNVAVYLMWLVRSPCLLLGVDPVLPRHLEICLSLNEIADLLVLFDLFPLPRPMDLCRVEERK